MREQTYQQIRVISCHDPNEFQRRFNEAQEELADKNPRVEFNMTQGHCAYIIYQEVAKMAETAEDEFAIDGIQYRCRNCPKFEWATTRSGEISRIQKKGRCSVNEVWVTWSDTCACEYLYKGILSGRIRAIEDESLEDFQIR